MGDSQITSITSKIEKEIKDEPKDTLKLVFIMFLFLGLLGFLPLYFFLTCTNYWMYKFRNVTANTTWAEDRTDLQALCNSSFGMVIAVGLPIYTGLVGAFGHKVDIKKRLIIGTVGTMLTFFVSAILVEVNTDDWQLEFFILTLIIIVSSQASISITFMSGFTLISQFPKAYSDIYITAQGISACVASFLQIVSLAIGISAQTSAFIYFSIGIGILATSLVLIILSFNSKFFQYHMCEYYKTPEKEDSVTFKESIHVFKKILPSVIVMFLFALVLVPTHTAVTSLIVSEGEGSGSAWTDTYFTPTITFFLGAIFDLVGRAAAPYIPMGKIPLIVFAFLRLAYVPLIMLCNAQPRHHLPVVFKHDYQYILILITFLASGGFLFSKTNLSIPLLVDKSEQKRGYHILTVCMSIILALLSPVNVLSVKLL